MSNTPLKNDYNEPLPMYLDNENSKTLKEKKEEMKVKNDQIFEDTTNSFYCASCKRLVWSRVDTRPGLLTYLCCCYICLIGGVLGCCFIPFCCKPCKDKYHFCSNCNFPLGVNKAL